MIPYNHYDRGNGIFYNDFGEPITPQLAMMQTAFSNGATLICDMVASASMSVYRRRADGGREEATDRSEYRLLHRNPNPRQTIDRFMWQLVYDCIVERFGMAELVGFEGRDGTAELWRIDPRAVRLPEPRAGTFETYIVEDRNEGNPRTDKGVVEFQNAEVAYFTMRSNADGYPVSFVELANEALGLGRAVSRYTGERYRNDPGIDTYLCTDQAIDSAKLNEETRRINEDARKYGRGKRLVLTCGMKPANASPNFNDAALLETRAFVERKIAGVFGIPLGILNYGESGGNVEELWYQLLTRCLNPWFRMIDNELSRVLFWTKGLDDYYVKHDQAAFLKGKFETTIRTMSLAITSGQMTINEARRVLDRPAVEGGDTTYVPANLSELAAATQGGVVQAADISGSLTAPPGSVDVFLGGSRSVEPTRTDIRGDGTQKEKYT